MILKEEELNGLNARVALETDFQSLIHSIEPVGILFIFLTNI